MWKPHRSFFFGGFSKFENQRRKQSCKRKPIVTLSPLTDKPSRSARKFIGRTTAQSGTPGITPKERRVPLHQSSNLEVRRRLPGLPVLRCWEEGISRHGIGGEDDDLTLGDTLADDAPTADSILMDEELLKALYDELDRLDPEGKRICELMMHHSEREAAEIMGMARSTFKRHWAKIRAVLQDKLKDYYI